MGDNIIHFPGRKASKSTSEIESAYDIFVRLIFPKVLKSLSDRGDDLEHQYQPVASELDKDIYNFIFDLHAAVDYAKQQFPAHDDQGLAGRLAMVCELLEEVANGADEVPERMKSTDYRFHAQWVLDILRALLEIQPQETTSFD